LVGRTKKTRRSKMEQRKQGKYVIIYEKYDNYGSLDNVKPGDIIRIKLDVGYRDFEIDKVSGSKWTKKFITKSIKAYDMVLFKSLIVDLNKDVNNIIKIMRVYQNVDISEESLESDEA
jgi:hypothetical protein